MSKQLIAKRLLFLLALIWTVNFLFYFVKSNSRPSIFSGQIMNGEKIFNSDSSGEFSDEEVNMMQSFEARIVRPKYDVDCKRIFELDQMEISRAKAKLETLRKAAKSKSIPLLSDENFVFTKTNCRFYKKIRFGKNQHKKLITNSSSSLFAPKNSETLSLAYSILVYNNIEQFERLLALIYHVDSIYCIHVDAKSSDTVKRAIKSIVDCFDNVFITTQTERIIYAGFSRLKADINCLNDLTNLTELINRHENLVGKRVVDWKYFFNLASSEFPLRTRRELTRILDVYNGSNEIEIIKKSIASRINFKWVETNDNKLVKTNVSKTPAPHGYKIVKGYAYVVLSRSFVEYAIRDRRAVDLLEWGRDTWSPDEWYWSTLQFNTQHYSKSGFKASDQETRINTIARFAGWYTEYECKGVWRHGVCVFSIDDLPEMINRRHFFVNKFLLEYDPISYQCMEEWYNERSSMNLTVNVFFYCNWIKPHSTIANCP